MNAEIDSLICALEKCKSKCMNDKKYCKKHQINIFLDETKALNKRPCANYIRKCRSQLDVSYTKKKCENCLSKERIKDKTRRGLAVDTSVTENNTKKCSKCNKEKEITCFEGEKGGFLQKAGINISFQDEKLLISGLGKKNPLVDYKLDSLHYIEKPSKENYLEIKAGELPDTIQKYIDFLFDNSNFEIPSITSQHLMMYGVEIDNIKGSMAVLPKFDAIFRFDKPISLSSIMANLSAIDKNLKNEGKNNFSIGTVTYYVQQLSKNEIYIGINERPIIILKVDPNFFELSGNLSSLFKIEGTGLIAQIAQMMPEVQNSKQFFGSVQAFDIHAYIDENDYIAIDGVMSFSQDRMASLEFFNYLIRF